MKNKTIQIVFIMLAVASSNLMANDTPVAIDPVGIGGIEFKKSKQISMGKETLTISVDLIRVEYEFINTSDKPIRERILFPMPFYRYDQNCEFGNREYSGTPDNFRIWVNGKELKPESMARAQMADGRDVTKRLKDIGFTDEDIAEYGVIEGQCEDVTPNENFSANMDLMVKEGLAQPKFPLWLASRAYYWDQEFPPHEKVIVVHEYTPFVSDYLKGRFDWSGKYLSIAFNQEPFCIDEATYRSFQRADTAELVPTEVDYILTTGANWAGPIKDFTLVLKKKEAGDAVSLCFDGHFKRNDSLTLVSNIKNFTPIKDLHVLFMSARRDIYPLRKYFRR